MASYHRIAGVSLFKYIGGAQRFFIGRRMFYKVLSEYIHTEAEMIRTVLYQAYIGWGYTKIFLEIYINVILFYQFCDKNWASRHTIIL